MAGKTNSDKISDLEKAVATLQERIDTARREMATVKTIHAETARVLADLRREHEREMALLKREVEDLKKWKDEQKKMGEERSRRLWAFGPNIIAALIGGLIAAAVAYFMPRR
jgi:predicted  nucleic acid-binding Zn-ribbon protein